eukprot:GHVL01038891.1.p1 GENE.GHVL01038891.1~~GHVL01038891.1.p1  ORF type:complete len:528 (+),score=101.26 GHVL01038891.1:78-1661(+)
MSNNQTRSPIEFAEIFSERLSAESANDDAFNSLLDAIGASSELSVERTSKAILKKCLAEAQEKTDNAHSELSKQAEANKELINSLNAIKDANARSMDVIQKQNGEIRTLTDSKVEAEERIERMRQVQRIEIEKYKNEALIRIESTKDAAQDQIKKAQTAMVEQLRELNESYEATKRENHNYLAKINEERQRHAQEMELKQLESETIRESLESKIEKIARELSNMHGCLEENKRTIFDLNNQLRIQKNKYFELVDDRSNSDKKLSQDIAHFKERATCLEHSLESERVGWFEERRTLEKHYEDVLQSRNSIEAASKSCQHSLACCRTELLTMESDMKTQNGVIGELRRQIRDGDEVLSGVMKANDHLRNELEDQRKRIIDANERELNDIRTKYEEEAARTKTIQKKFVETLEAQIQSVYHDAANKETELECTRQQAESIDRERRSLHNDLSIWKSQCESISQMREVAEEKIAHLSRELSLLKSSHLEEKVCEASSLEVAQDRINELQRVANQNNSFKYDRRWILKTERR